MYEIAIAINSICFDKKKLNLQKAKALIKGYSQVKKIPSKEINYLPILCLGAAIRFFVTRLYDYKFTPKKAKVKKKDPKEYLFKMRFFAKKINEIKFHE
jgi:homoserine kinase type II